MREAASGFCIDVRDLYSKMTEALDKYEQAKITFKWVTEAYTRDDNGNEIRDPAALINMQRRAKQDPDRQKAIDDCAFHSNEAIMYATAITALRP